MIREGETEDKTKLDNDASIYQKRETRSYKETMADLKGFEKIEYFCHYYLGKVLFIAAIAAIVIYILYSIFRVKPENIFYMAVINSPIADEYYDGVRADLTEIFVADDVHEQIYVDTSYYMYDGRSDYEMRMAFVTHIAAAEIDVLILPKSELETQVNNTSISKLNDVLDSSVIEKLKRYGVGMLSVKPVIGPQDDTSIEPVEDLYGIDVTDKLLALDADKMRERYYLAFVVNSTHTSKYENFVKYLFSNILGMPEFVKKIAD